MKKAVSLLLLCAFLCTLLCSCGEQSSTEENKVLYVYNWGEYISDGSDDTMDVVEEFEKRYGVTVKYDYYSTNEELYAKLSSGAVYDVVVPSDYMIQRLREEGYLAKIDTSLLSNYGNLDEQYLGKYYDPTSEYSVPYAVGMIGIVYNREHIRPEDVADRSWDLLWNENYGADKLINFNNPRDAFGVAMLSLGMDVNTTDPEDWQRAFEYLRQQKCMYLMDEVFNKMESGAAWAAAYYAGDCISMMATNPDLDFYYPVEGTNIFVDAMCIPENAQNRELAHKFIDFILDPDVATANANYICYASPNKEVLEHPSYDYPEGEPGYDLLYNIPEAYRSDPDNKMQYYHRMPEDTQWTMNDLWYQLGISNETLSVGQIVAISVMAAALVAAVVYFSYSKYKKRKAIEDYRAKKAAQGS